jgi:hypothetical protein
MATQAAVAGSTTRRGMLSWHSGTASGWLVTQRGGANGSRMKLWSGGVVVMVETSVSSGFMEAPDTSGEGGGPTVRTFAWLEAGASSGPRGTGQRVKPTSEPGLSPNLHPAHVTPPEGVARSCTRRLGPSQIDPKNCCRGVRCLFPAPRPCDQEKPRSTHESGGRWRTELERPNRSYGASHKCPGDRDPPCEAVHELGATVGFRKNDSADTRAVARARCQTRATALKFLSESRRELSAARTSGRCFAAATPTSGPMCWLPRSEGRTLNGASW